MENAPKISVEFSYSQLSLIEQMMRKRIQDYEWHVQRSSTKNQRRKLKDMKAVYKHVQVNKFELKEYLDGQQ